VAAHRRSSPRSLGRGTARTAVTIVLAGAATATAFDGTGHADPRFTPAQVRAKVDTLYEEAEIATEKYNGTKEKAERTRQHLNGLQDEAARRTDRLSTARESLGSYAAAQYRAGGFDPTVQLLLSPDPSRYLDGVALAERTGHRQSAAVSRVREQLREIEQLRGAAHVQLASLASRQTELRRQKHTVTAKLAEARKLLSGLPTAQRAGLAPHGGDHASRSAAQSTEPAPATTAQAPTSRAAAAVAYAYAKLGSPYIWGAAGPNAFDCSGLAQAAYRSAGVSLPRTTYAQINAGRRVARSELLPGDLVFFYSGISHVGIYVGHGQMIHAPNPSAPVRLAPVDEMPFTGATRVA
jgi:cell wall-associated NlpC family hydrolase